uniref:Ig-like domain-containing protein n=1 Tax=Cyprinus carpio TaxID=7962 RepID=A0A8C1L4S8_CYPCA
MKLQKALCRLVVCSEWHIFPTLYTEINGETIAGFPEVSAVTTLDGQQIDYYDSVIKKLIPKQDWMKKFASGDRWKEYTEYRERVQQINKLNIPVLMQRFNQSHGVHTYQRMYGCDWDDETGKLHGFDQHGYDGEDFITLDMKDESLFFFYSSWIASLTLWFYVNLLHKFEVLSIFIILFSQSFVAPEVSLLQRSSSSPVSCHASGFYPAGVTITWLRNGEDHDEEVDLGELLPNEDGTFQKTSILRVPPDEWKKDQYVCVVKHETETIQKILKENEIKSNDSELLKVPDIKMSCKECWVNSLKIIVKIRLSILTTFEFLFTLFVYRFGINRNVINFIKRKNCMTIN